MSTPAKPDPADFKRELEELTKKIGEQIDSGNSFDLTEVSDAERTVAYWLETNAALAKRLDLHMKRSYGVETDYEADFGEATTNSFYYGVDREVRRRQLKEKIDKQLKELRWLQDKVRRDVVKYGGTE